MAARLRWPLAATVVAISVVLALAGCGDDAAQERKAQEQRAAADAQRQRYLREHPEIAQRMAADAQRAKEELAARQLAGARCVEAAKGRRLALPRGLFSTDSRIRLAVTETDAAFPGDVAAYEKLLPAVVRASGPSATHLVCIAEKRSTIERCTYGTGSHSVERTRAALEITVIDVKAGTAFLSPVVGAEPPACPASVPKSQSSSTTLAGPRIPEGVAIQDALGRELYDQLRREETRLAAVARKVRWIAGVKDPKQLEPAAQDPEPEIRAAAARRLQELGGK